MNWTKLLWVLVTLAMILSVFAACSSPSTSTTTPKPGTTPGATGQPAAQTTYNWRLQSIYPPTQFNYKQVDEIFIPTVAKLTNNRIKITQYPPAALAPSSEIFGALGAGQFEMADFVTVYNIGTFPEGNIEFPIPGGIRDPVIARAFANDWEPLGQQANEERGVHRLFVRQLGLWYGTISAKPIPGIASLKGMKIRTTGLYSNIAERLGASPTTLALEDIYTGLTLGTVDAQTYNGPAVWLNLKFMEPAKYAVYPCEGGSLAGGGFGMNLNLWKSLSPDLQEALTMAAMAFGEANALRTNIENEQAVAAFTSTYGGQIQTWSATDVDKYSQVSLQVWDEQVAVKNARCAQGTQMLKDWLNKEKHPYLWLARDNYIGMK